MAFKGHIPWNKGRKLPAHTEEHKRKVSETLKGRMPKFIPSTKGIKFSKERIDRMRGKNSPHWKGGITSLTSQIRNCFKYRQWRSDIYTRDGFACVLCNDKNGNLTADHYPKMFSIIFYENNIKNLNDAEKCEEFWNLNNGRTLCLNCHKKTDTWGHRSKKYVNAK